MLYRLSYRLTPVVLLGWLSTAPPHAGFCAGSGADLGPLLASRVRPMRRLSIILRPVVTIVANDPGKLVAGMTSAISAKARASNDIRQIF